MIECFLGYFKPVSALIRKDIPGARCWTSRNSFFLFHSCACFFLPVILARGSKRQ